MALEQCHYPRNILVTNYILFLDYLIESEEDVDLLIKKGKRFSPPYFLYTLNDLCGGFGFE